MGGYCTETEEVREDSNYEYDPESDMWESLPDLPVPILAPGIAVIKGKIFVIGGSAIENGAQTASDRVYVFDVSKNSWGTSTRLPKGIQFPGVTFIDDRIYVIGGCDKEFKAYAGVYEGILSASSRARDRTSKPKAHRTGQEEQSLQANPAESQPRSVSKALCGLLWPKAYI